MDELLDHGAAQADLNRVDLRVGSAQRALGSHCTWTAAPSNSRRHGRIARVGARLV
jgi:hypothetical protein